MFSPGATPPPPATPSVWGWSFVEGKNSMADNTPYESREYDQLVRRGFTPYSGGHQKMYTTAIATIGKPSIIFEAGFGIGFGLQKMLEAGVVSEYTGVEPNPDAYRYVAETLGMRNDNGPSPHVHLHPDAFSQEYADTFVRIMGRADEAFCIEVIEHVPMNMHLQFLIALRQIAPRLWFSSPDKTKSKEGVRSMKEWMALLKQAKFDVVDVDKSNWTYLYQCK